MRKELQELNELIRTCTRCPLHQNRKNAVPGEGNDQAAVVFVGEAPGEKEDLQGRPFCGRTGLFLDKLFAEVGIKRAEVFITSSVKCRPPKNRTPLKNEWETCRELWLKRQLSLIQPRLVVLFGKVALEQSLGETGKLADIHGQVRQKNGIAYLITYHPTAGMRFPAIAKAMKKDLEQLQNVLKGR